MSHTASLFAASLHYPPDLVLHTAASGAIAGLDELYLLIERDGETVGLGEVRENVEYLTGVPPARIRADVAAMLECIDWSVPPPPEEIHARFPDTCTPARCLIDCTLHDVHARRAGIPLGEYLDGRFTGRIASNHCISWGDDATLERLAKRCVDRGFEKLKLRVGVASFDRDLERLAKLRALIGSGRSLAVDANARWTAGEAGERMQAMRVFNLDHVEQPLARDDWKGLDMLVEELDTPIMLDEGVDSLAAVDRVIGYRGRVWAHLKLVKLGGIVPVLEAARRLRAHGVPFMLGQMNEGSAATAAAIHTAMAVRVPMAELYGADGLRDDPVTGVWYERGGACVKQGAGLGTALDPRGLRLIARFR